jgi:hypothetical protein
MLMMLLMMLMPREGTARCLAADFLVCICMLCERAAEAAAVRAADRHTDADTSLLTGLCPNLRHLPFNF